MPIACACARQVAMVLASGVMAGNMMPVNAATAKSTLPFAAAITRAILANWLVCIAVKQAAASSSLPGKMLAIWPPITAFIALGLEHSGLWGDYRACGSFVRQPAGATAPHIFGLPIK
jgi:formate/nitrite transporter FocA (FNT family)